MTTARWLLRRHRRPDAPIRLYLFPHSGGSAGEYLRWSDDLPAVEVFGVQAPGRGGRLAEPAPTSMAELVDALVSTVEFAGPYAFFGHSLGAAVAYETAVALRDRGRPGPCGLYLSAFEAPHARRPGLPVHGLDEPALIAAVEQRYGPLPAELHEDPEWRRLVLGGLRADLQIVHGYRHSPAAPLPCPITALGGTEDWVAEQDLAGWARYTTGAFTLRLFAGDHFYFREQRDDVLGFLSTDLARTDLGRTDLGRTDLAHAAERADRAVPGAAAVGPAAAVPRPAA